MIDFVCKVKQWVRTFIGELLHVADARVVVMTLVLVAFGSLLFKPEQSPMILTALQFSVLTILGGLIAHLTRKFTLDNKIRMSHFAEKAIDGNIAAAIGFVGLLGFTYGLISLTVNKILS